MENSKNYNINALILSEKDPLVFPTGRQPNSKILGFSKLCNYVL